MSYTNYCAIFVVILKLNILIDVNSLSHDLIFPLFISRRNKCVHQISKHSYLSADIYIFMKKKKNGNATSSTLHPTKIHIFELVLLFAPPTIAGGKHFILKHMYFKALVTYHLSFVVMPYSWVEYVVPSSEEASNMNSLFYFQYSSRSQIEAKFCLVL